MIGRAAAMKRTRRSPTARRWFDLRDRDDLPEIAAAPLAASSRSPGHSQLDHPPYSHTGAGDEDR